MLTILIILSLASFSFQIENCIETEKVCKTCKVGYTNQGKVYAKMYEKWIGW